jgi:hypothetical protein
MAVRPYKELYDVLVEKKAETDSAWLLNDGVSEDWFPKSQCEPARRPDGRLELTAPQWLLQSKGFL